MLKTGLDITAYQLKSAICDNISQCIKHSYESLCIITIRIMLDIVDTYNKNRLDLLRTRLKKI